MSNYCSTINLGNKNYIAHYCINVSRCKVEKQKQYVFFFLSNVDKPFLKERAFQSS